MIYSSPWCINTNSDPQLYQYTKDYYTIMDKKPPSSYILTITLPQEY